jgi:hypothetical protein
VLALLKSGALIEPARIRRVAFALIVFYVAAMAMIFATSPDGLRDYKERPIGSDFMAIWTAGAMAAEGRGVDAYDPLKNFEALQDAMGDETPPNLPFLHPPQVLLAAAPFSHLPYVPAWALFAALSAAAFLAASTRLAPKGWGVLAAVAAPAFFLNIANGQMGLVIAAAFAAGALTMERRPFLAGVFFGLVAMKPQYGLLIPLAFAMGGHWRAFAGAAMSVLAQAGAATIAFGAGVWPAFAGKLSYASDLLLAGGGLAWPKFISLYGGLRGLGLAHDAALAGQLVFAAAIAATVALLWRSGADLRLKLAGLIAGALLASPYALDYDAALMLPAVALVLSVGLERGFAPYEKSVLALAFLAPVAGFQVAELTLVPLTFLSAAILYAAILRRAELTFRFPLARAAV